MDAGRSSHATCTRGRRPPVSDRAAPAATIATRAHESASAPNAAYLTDATLTRSPIDRGARSRAASCARRSAAPAATVEPDTLPPGARASSTRRATRHRRRAPNGAGIWNVAARHRQRRSSRSPTSTSSPMLPFNAKQNGQRRPLLHRQLARASDGQGVGPKQGAVGELRESAGLHRGDAGERRHAASPSTSSCATSSRTTSRTSGRSISCCSRSSSTSSSSCWRTSQAHGVDVSGVKVMSGFRTPQYNEGGGNTRRPSRPQPSHVRRRVGHLHRQQPRRCDGRPQP